MWDRATAAGLGLLNRSFRANVRELLHLTKFAQPADHVRLAAVKAAIEGTMKTREHFDLSATVAELVARQGAKG